MCDFVLKALRIMLVAVLTTTAVSAATGQAVDKKPVTVADAIEMTRLADPGYASGDSSKGRVALFSPDGKRFVVILRRGNLEQNTNVFSLLLFETATVFVNPKPTTLLTLESSSNRDAIANAKWLNDNSTLAFLGERPGETAQVYSLDVSTRDLKQRTHHSTSIINYDITLDGSEIVFIAEPTKRRSTGGRAQSEGMAITSQKLDDILGGDCAPTSWAESRQLFLQKGSGSATAIPVTDRLDRDAGLNFLSLSPNGRYALFDGWAKENIPTTWAEYESEGDLVRQRVTQKRQNSSQDIGLMRFLLLDTQNHQVAPLLNTPMEWYNSTAKWAPDSQSVFLSTRLPLDIADTVQRAEREKKLYDIQLSVPSKTVLTLRSMDEETMLDEEEKKRGEREGHSNSAIDVVLEEDMNTPPRIYSVNRGTTRKSLLLDLNPQFASLDLGRVEAVEWKASNELTALGGLYFPPDYQSGRHYPLVIQTHGFDPSRFSMDGLNEWSSAFAARPLAGAGFLVLQVSGFKEGFTSGNTPKEGSAAMAAFEGAIDYLDKRGMIDPHRVGIIGFSRTVFTVAFALTHSTYRFGAAVLTDGMDAGYLQFLIFNPGDDVALNGAEPFGEGLSQWLKNSPGFNLDKVQTPVRLLALNPGSLIGTWEWFSGLSILRKPVDLIYLPDATHIVVKPWERRVAQQGLVDWFRFWLSGEEDPNPAKANEYARWRELKKLQQSNEQLRSVSDD